MITSKATDLSLLNNKTSPQQQQLQLIEDLKHIIHYIAVLLRILQWKQAKKTYSLTLLCALVLHSTLYRFILYAAPALYIYSYYNREINSETRHHRFASSHYSLIDDLTEIRDKIQWITAMINWFQQESDTVYRLYYKKYVSISSARQRSMICFAVSCLFILFYAGWLILLQQIDLTFLVCCSLLVIMCAYCPWSHPIQTACVRAVSPLLLYAFPSSATTTTTTHIKAPIAINKLIGEKYITGYCFEIYHHQRWWFPTGWSNLLLPQDRPVWSDIYSEATPSIQDFRLPPAVNIGKPNEHNQQKIASWTWMDPNWSKYQDSSTDSAGWKYGNWQWKNWSCRSSGYTRKRKWYRYAERIESWIDVAPTEENKCNSVENVSTSSAPSSIFDGSTCSSNSTTSSISYITANSPILISFNNKGQRMLRRHSSNIFTSRGIAFNMNTPELCSNSPSADDMYMSPNPYKFKRLSI